MELAQRLKELNAAHMDEMLHLVYKEFGLHQEQELFSEKTEKRKLKELRYIFCLFSNL